MKKFLTRNIFFIIFIFVFIISAFLTAYFHIHTYTITKIDKDVTYSIIENDITTAYQKTSKSCVGIYASSDKTVATGSGVIYKRIDDTFYVITNYHVINGEEKYSIYYNGEYEKASLIGAIEDIDIAILSFNFSYNNRKLIDEVLVCDFLNYSDIKIPQVGERALIIGCPVGIENYNTLTVGVISLVTKTDIHTDTTINVGNSGGGMFNIKGELLGIVYKKALNTNNGTMLENRGYVIPLSIVKKSVKAIEEANQSTTGIVKKNIALPFEVKEINRVKDENSSYCDYLPNDNKNTHLVVRYSKNYRILPHSTLLKINDEEVNTEEDLNYFIKTTLSGTTVTFTFYENDIGNYDIEIIL